MRRCKASAAAKRAAAMHKQVREAQQALQRSCQAANAQCSPLVEAAEAAGKNSLKRARARCSFRNGMVTCNCKQIGSVAGHHPNEPLSGTQPRQQSSSAAAPRCSNDSGGNCGRRNVAVATLAGLVHRVALSNAEP